jgi:uncharacterized protein (DUF1810 family)
MKKNDPYDLQRFIDAQSRWIEQACKELQEGRKQSHWMWFIFPQLKGLGHSAMANHYGISSRREAEAYLAHPTLGTRLGHCTGLVLALEGRDIEQIFGSPDDLKFRSSMTLFARIDAPGSVFAAALEKYFARKPDQLTIDRLSESTPSTWTVLPTFIPHVSGERWDHRTCRVIKSSKSATTLKKMEETAKVQFHPDAAARLNELAQEILQSVSSLKNSGLEIEHDPGWRVVARVFLPTRPSVNTAVHEPDRQIRWEQKVIESHAFVLLPPFKFVIPECPERPVRM